METVMKRRLSVAVLVLLAAALSHADQSTPAKTIETFAKAFEQGDAKTAIACVKGGKVNAFATQMFARFVKDKYRFKVSVSQVKTVGSTANAMAVTTVTSSSMPTQNVLKDKVALVKQSGKWLIVPAPGSNVSESFVNPAGEILTNPERIEDDAKQAIKATECLRNIKQLALAILLFTGDNDDYLRFTPVNWLNKVRPYAQEPVSFTCPLDKSGTISYSFNAKLAGKNTVSIKNVMQTVLLYEGKNGKLSFRHRGRACVAFVDGSAKLVTVEEAKKLIWKP